MKKYLKDGVLQSNFKRQMLKSIHILVFAAIQGRLLAQTSIPVPNVYYDFEQKNLTTNLAGTGATAFYAKIPGPQMPMLIHSGTTLSLTRIGLGTIHFLDADRSSGVSSHGGYGNIKLLNGTGVMQDPYLWGLFRVTRVTGIVPVKQGITDYTVACWIYVSTTVASPQKRMIFFGGSDQDDARPVIGLAHDYSGVYLIRNVQVAGSRKSYEIPLAMSAALDAGSGWYFVSLVSTALTTQVFVGRPNRKFECTLFGFGSQDNSDAFTYGGPWGIGTMSSAYAPVNAIDDFIVWGKALSSDQIKALFLCSFNRSPEDCWGGTPLVTERITAAKPVTEMPSASEEIEDQLTVFPNPSRTGNFTINLSISNDTPVELQLMSVQGAVILKNETMMQKGVYQFALEDFDIGTAEANGLYILRVKTNKLNEVRKLIIAR